MFPSVLIFFALSHCIVCPLHHSLGWILWPFSSVTSLAIPSTCKFIPKRLLAKSRHSILFLVRVRFSDHFNHNLDIPLFSFNHARFNEQCTILNFGFLRHYFNASNSVTCPTIFGFLIITAKNLNEKELCFLSHYYLSTFHRLKFVWALHYSSGRDSWIY